MKYRTLGKTGLRLSVLGFGGGRLYAGATGSGATDAEVVRVLSQARALGCNCFDTSPLYGAGQSERLLGSAFESCRQEVVFITKFGITADRQADHDLRALRRSLEGSLHRLRTNYVDVLMLHNPPPTYLAADHPIHEALSELRREGKLRFVGVSLDSVEDLTRAANSARFDVAEVVHNVMCQHALPAFPLAHANGLGLVLKSPLDSGWLSGKYDAESRFEGSRSRWTRAVLTARSLRYRRLSECYPAGWSPVDVALSFALAAPGVAAVLPASRSVEQLQSNAQACSRTLPPEVVAVLEERWRREFSGLALPW